MIKKKKFPANHDGLGEAVAFIQLCFEKYGMKGKDNIRAQLTAEEAIGSLLAHAEEGSSFTVSVKALVGTAVIEIVSAGEEYDFNLQGATPVLDEDTGDTMQETIRSILLKSYTSNIRYHHFAKKNWIRMTVARSPKAFLYQTLGAMFLAVLVGFLLSKAGSPDFNGALVSNVLNPVKTMYMNALKIIVAPVVFFSIITCVAQFSDLSELGRIGGKVMALYLVTTVVAVAIGIGAYYLFQPGSSVSMEQVTDASSITSQTMNVSLRDTIVGIVPSNFVKPFLESNMLQLIFLAVLCGVAIAKLGTYSEMLTNLIEAMNELFLKVTTMIIRVMPLAVFCSITATMLTMGTEAIASVLGMFATFLFGLACLMLTYCVILLVFARLNPLTFIRKYSPTMLQVFSMASSNASIPINMAACDSKLGIAQKVYSLSIPLGATVNMHGTCIHLAVFSLALAKLYGVEITGAAILSLVVTIIVLSMGAPGVPGSGLICLSVLLTQIGVPVEAIGLVMGIDTLIGMFRCMVNCLGDVAVTTVVAKSEGLMDLETYNAA